MYASSSSPTCSTIRARNVIATIVVVIIFLSSGSYAQLSPHFYAKKCNETRLFAAVSQAVKNATDKEKRMGASLLRLHFHDCFIQGCDASILLDDILGSFIGEKTAVINNNSARGFEVIDDIKSAVEGVCPGVVSCADIIAIAARDSVVQLGGQPWEVQLGRRDSLNASFSLANGGAVPSIFSNLSVLMTTFGNVGLNTTDTVALSGAHTIGDARCVTFRRRIYNESTIDASFASDLKKNCPSTQGTGDSNLAHFDRQTPYYFDNKYYGNLMNRAGLLHTDQILRDGGNITIAALVEQYSKDQDKFFNDFGAAMIKMGNIAVLTGSQGQIRKNCRRVLN